MDVDTLERVKAAAEKFRESFPEQNLDYNEESVAWADGFIERQRIRPEMQDGGGLAQVVGCFLGECIRKNFGGEWESTENGLAMTFNNGNSCFPLNKAQKHFANGDGDSILSFYQTIPILFGDHLNAI